MCSDKPITWHVIGKWIGRQWHPLAAYRSRRTARRARTNNTDIRPFRFKYLD